VGGGRVPSQGVSLVSLLLLISAVKREFALAG